MLTARYRNKALIPEKALDLPEGTSVVLELIPTPPPGSLALLARIKVRAVYQGGALILRRPLTEQEGSQVDILALSTLRPPKSFQGLLQDAKENALPAQSVTKRPIWEIVAAIGTEIPDDEWVKVPQDASVNYNHYLYGAPKKDA